MAVADNDNVKLVVVNNRAEKLLNWYENKVLDLLPVELEGEGGQGYHDSL